MWQMENPTCWSKSCHMTHTYDSYGMSHSYYSSTVKKLTEGTSLDEIRDVSAGAAAFYVWVYALIETCKLDSSSDLSSTSISW